MAEIKLRHTVFLRREIIAAVVFFSANWANSSPLNSTADLMEGKSWSVGITGQYLKKEPIIELSGNNAIAVPVSGGGTNTIFSNSNADVEMEQEGQAVIAQFAVKPGETFQYQFRIGQVQSYQLEYSSGSSTNSLESLGNGLTWGFGVGGRIAPGSIVSTAISWQLDYNQKNIDLDRFSAGGSLSSSSIKMEEEEYQAAINFSRRWKMIEPYGGLKVLKTVTHLKDTGTGDKVSGSTDGVSPFIGLQWWFAEKEVFLIEGSFVEEESVSAALKVQF